MLLKKILAYIGCAIATWGGLWFVFLAKTVPDAKTAALYIFGAAIAFLLAILCAGYGNSLIWPGKEKE